MSSNPASSNPAPANPAPSNPAPSDRAPRGRRGLRWWWLAAAVLLLGLTKLLLSAVSVDSESAATDHGLRTNTRKPFPKDGPASGLPRPVQVKPMSPSAPEPWRDGRKRE